MPKRKRRQRVTKYALLVVCEGEQTETNYFRSFNSDKIAVEAIPIVGQPVQIVQKAIGLQERRNYDEVWVVFDLDYNPSQGNKQFEQFNKALAKAKKNRLHIAYSIDCFELWFRLHYEQITGAISRKSLYKDLSKRWDINYEKNGKEHQFAKTIRNLLEDDEKADISKAIERAKKMFDLQKDLPLNERNPITTVHLLVERLLSFK